MTTQTSLSPGSSGAYGEPGSSTSEAGAAVKDHAAQVAGSAKEQAATVADEAKSQARDLVGEARSQVRQQVDTQRHRVSDMLREVSEDLEQMAERSDRNGIAADLVRQTAARARTTWSYLDGGGDIVADVHRFARRKPGVFLLGAVAAGVLAGRASRAAAAARRAGSTSDDSRANDLRESVGQGYSGQSHLQQDYPAQSYPGQDPYVTGGSYSPESPLQPAEQYSASTTSPQATYEAASPQPTTSEGTSEQATYPQPTYAEPTPEQPGAVSGSAPEAFTEKVYPEATPLVDPEERA